MHFSAKRGIAIACRQSVCLSVRLLGWTFVALLVSPYFVDVAWQKYDNAF